MPESRLARTRQNYAEPEMPLMLFSPFVWQCEECLRIIEKAQNDGATYVYLSHTGETVRLR